MRKSLKCKHSLAHQEPQLARGQNGKSTVSVAPPLEEAMFCEGMEPSLAGEEWRRKHQHGIDAKDCSREEQLSLAPWLPVSPLLLVSLSSPAHFQGLFVTSCSFSQPCELSTAFLRGEPWKTQSNPSYAQLDKEVCGLYFHLMGPFTVCLHILLSALLILSFFSFNALEMCCSEQTASVQETNVYGHFPAQITDISCSSRHVMSSPAELQLYVSAHVQACVQLKQGPVAGAGLQT